VVSTARVLGAVLAIVQGVLSARYFGASSEKDSYLVAQAIPGLVTTFLVGGVYATLLVSLAEIGRREGIAGQHSFARRTLRHVTLALAPFLAVAFLVPRLIVSWTAPGFGPPSVNLAASLLRITALGALGTIVFTGTRCVYEARYQFVVPAFIGLLTPLVSLLILVTLVGRIGIFSLAVGPLLGVGLAVGLLAALLRKTLVDPPGFVAVPATAADRSLQARRFWMALVPMSVGANFGQINLLVDNAFGSYLPTGSITMLGFAFVIVSNAQLLTTSSLAEVAFPRLAAAALGSRDDLLATLRSNLRYMVLATAPIGAGAVAFGKPLVRLLFQRGQFGPESTAGVARVLTFYAPGIVFSGYLALYTLVLVARKRYAQVAWTSMGAVLINAVLDYVLIKPLALGGIALATTCVTLFHVLLVAPFVRRQVPVLRHRGDTSFDLRAILSAVIMGLVVWAGATLFERRFDTSSEAVRLVEVIGGLGLGAAAYVGLLHAMRLDEARTLARRILASLARWAPR